MKERGGSERAKRNAGEHAADLAYDGMVVGLGTGSTAAHAIRAIGRADLDVRGIPTSYQSRDLAREAGIPLASLDEATPDLAIDGADQVAGRDLVKGGGAAHAREKYVAAAAGRFVVVVDPAKVVQWLDHPVPLAVLPEARTTVADDVLALGGQATLRSAERKDGPVVTDDGNLVLDCDFGTVDDPGELAAELAAIPGVVEHGLFVGMADQVVFGTDDGVEVEEW